MRYALVALLIAPAARSYRASRSSGGRAHGAPGPAATSAAGPGGRPAQSSAGQENRRYTNEAHAELATRRRPPGSNVNIIALYRAHQNRAITSADARHEPLRRQLVAERWRACPRVDWRRGFYPAKRSRAALRASILVMQFTALAWFAVIAPRNTVVSRRRRKKVDAAQWMKSRRWT